MVNDGINLELFFGKAGEKVAITVESFHLCHYLPVWCFLRFKSIKLVLHLSVLYHPYIGESILK